MHEVEGALEGATSEVAFPNFHGDALGRVPSIWAESVRTRKAFNPHAGLRHVGD
jgi:hypothetical protein